LQKLYVCLNSSEKTDPTAWHARTVLAIGWRETELMIYTGHWLAQAAVEWYIDPSHTSFSAASAGLR
jgi:hypothetical protein